MSLLLCLLLSVLLIVLVIGDIVLVATVCGVWVRSVILGILRTVVSCRIARACSRRSRGSLPGRRFWRRVLLLLLMVVITAVTTSIATMVMAVSSLAIATVVVLRRVLLKPLVLFPDVD